MHPCVFQPRLQIVSSALLLLDKRATPAGELTGRETAQVRSPDVRLGPETSELPKRGGNAIVLRCRSGTRGRRKIGERRYREVNENVVPV